MLIYRLRILMQQPPPIPPRRLPIGGPTTTSPTATTTASAAVSSNANAPVAQASAPAPQPPVPHSAPLSQPPSLPPAPNASIPTVAIVTLTVDEEAGSSSGNAACDADASSSSGGKSAPFVGIAVRNELDEIDEVEIDKADDEVRAFPFGPLFSFLISLQQRQSSTLISNQTEISLTLCHSVRQEAEESSHAAPHSSGAAAPSAAAASGGPTPLISAASNTVAALGLQTRSMNVPSVRAFGAARASDAAAGPGTSHFLFPNRSFYSSDVPTFSFELEAMECWVRAPIKPDCCSVRHLVRRSRQLPSRCLSLCNAVPIDC